MNNNLITVFTPTFNRAYTLETLYKSLVLQNNKNFEWLIVDDGSTDNTENLIKEIKKTAPFSIRYLKTTNGGKHRAINKGVKIAKGFLFFIVDSDDFLTNDAIDKLFCWEKTIKYKDNYAGVSGNKGDLNKRLLGETFSGTYIDATNLERNENNILGDKAEAYYTEILKNFPFPEIPGENFITEDIVWNQIAAFGLKIRWFNDVIYIVEQRDDGLIAQGKMRFANNPIGYSKYILQKEKYLNFSKKEKLYSGYYFYDTVKSRVSILYAAKLLKRNFWKFSIFWIWQTLKISIKGRIQK